MTFKEFGENAELEYTLTITVNGEEATEYSSHSEESMLEGLRKADEAIKRSLTEQWDDLPENQESEE